MLDGRGISVNVYGELGCVLIALDQRYVERTTRKPQALHNWRALRYPDGALDTLAEALLSNGQAGEALTIEKQAFEINPQNPEVRTSLDHFREAAEQATRQASTCQPCRPLRDHLAEGGPAQQGLTGFEIVRSLADASAFGSVVAFAGQDF